jgi:uncharacterized membrane protein
MKCMLIAVVIGICSLVTPSSGFTWNKQSTRINLNVRTPRFTRNIVFKVKDEIMQKLSLKVATHSSTEIETKSQTDGNVKPQYLFKQYGAAYLITSITLAIISYAVCYLSISKGVDVVTLLSRIGIKSSVAATNTGTAAIAYAVHKAASPIRFPPTVVLTPVVAGWFGKKI